MKINPDKKTVVVLLFILFTALYILRDPLLFGKSFTLTNLYKYPPWSSLTEIDTFSDNNAGTDGVFTFFPRKVYARRCMGKGNFPFWNNFNLAGAPFAADPHTALFYPPNILHLLLDPGNAFKIIAFIQLSLAGIFMFGFLRETGLGISPAAFGALLFQFNTFMITHLMNPTNVDSAIWLPAMLWIFERWIGKGRLLTGIALLSLAMTLTILGGFPPAIVFSFYCFMGYACVSIIAICLRARKVSQLQSRTGKSPETGFLVNKWLKGNMGVSWRGVLLVTGGLGLAIFLTCVQTFQTVELVRFSARKVNDINWFRSIFLPFETLVTYIIPDFFGSPARSWIGSFSETIRNLSSEDSFWRNSYQENAAYMGVLPLLLAIIGAVKFSKKRVPAYFAGVAIVSILLTTGTPLFYFAFYTLPGFKFARICRIVYLYSTGIAVLAAYGFSWLKDEGKEASTFFAGILFWGLIAFFITILPLTHFQFIREELLRMIGSLGLEAINADSGFISVRISAWLNTCRRILWNYSTWYHSVLKFWLLLLIPLSVIVLFCKKKIGGKFLSVSLFYITFIDLAIFTTGFLTFQNGLYPSRWPGSLEFLHNDQEPFRITRYGEFRKVLPPNSALFYGLEDIQGSNALLIDKLGKLTELIDPAMYIGNKKVISINNRKALASPILNLMNVKYILSDHFLPALLPGVDPMEPGLAHFERIYAGEINIYRNRKVLPRAFIAHDAKICSGEKEVLDFMADSTFDFRNTVLLLEDPPFDLPENNDPDDSEAVITKYGNNDVVIETASDRNGILFISDLYFPGWECRIDGLDQEIYRANYTFRGVPLEAGEHTVVFSYRPSYWIPGLILTITGLFALVIIFFISIIGHKNGVLREKYSR